MPAHDPPRLYHDLAHLWPRLSPASDYEAESRQIMSLLDEHGPERGDDHRPTLLDLGAGGGHHLVHFLDAYDVVAVDLSDAMLAQCRELVPGVDTVVADMRSVRLERKFDAVLAHDAIDYMLTEQDLRDAFATAAAHLNPGGLFLVAPTYVSETFEDHACEQDHHADGDTELSLVSYVRRHTDYPTLFDLLLIILAREEGRLTVEEDRHTCGLFDTPTWLRLLHEADFDARVQERDDGPYRMFVAIKRGAGE